MLCIQIPLIPSHNNASKACDNVTWLGHASAEILKGRLTNHGHFITETRSFPMLIKAPTEVHPRLGNFYNRLFQHPVAYVRIKIQLHGHAMRNKL